MVRNGELKNQALAVLEAKWLTAALHSKHQPDRRRLARQQHTTTAN